MTVNRYDRKVCEQTILDRRVFLEPKELDQFLAQLDAPVSPSTEPRTMLTRKAPGKAKALDRWATPAPRVRPPERLTRESAHENARRERFDEDVISEVTQLRFVSSA